MAAFAFYRLPYADEYVRMVQHEDNPEELYAYTALNGKSGFVFAPFAISENTPILLLHPDEVRSEYVPVGIGEESTADRCFCAKTQSSVSKPSSSYTIDFANFHAQLEQQVFRKIVLARCKDIETDASWQAENLFYRACRCYPRMFVALVSTPQGGTWLMATPEILLEGNGNQWRTMALAGTMKLEGELLNFDVPLGDVSKQISWATKDIQEQRYVATYITECLEQFTRDFTEEGPYTCRAGNLVHLRSDFTFSLEAPQRLGNVLETLHPTPAVCGIPKDETRRFILENECAPRKYYSGFAGPLNPAGETRLFVSLRCMEIFAHRYRLYAGGGLLKDSVEEREWEETEAKMETMMRVIS